jgi:hypothetical protein
MLTKPEIEDWWNQARQLEDATISENCNAIVCACCGHRCPRSDMHIGLTNTTIHNILKVLISSETKAITRPSRIRLSISSKDYVVHDSYIGKNIF